MAPKGQSRPSNYPQLGSNGPFLVVLGFSLRVVGGCWCRGIILMLKPQHHGELRRRKAGCLAAMGNENMPNQSLRALTNPCKAPYNSIIISQTCHESCRPCNTQAGSPPCKNLWFKVGHAKSLNPAAGPWGLPQFGRARGAPTLRDESQKCAPQLRWLGFEQFPLVDLPF